MKMKKTILTLFLIIGSFTMQSQDSSESEQAKQLTWHTDINKAIEISNKSKKPLMLFFTGSDWCGWCIRLQKEVLTNRICKMGKRQCDFGRIGFPEKNCTSS